ncbi:hypothetical protein [Helicobacter sp. T3_23-1059]
MISFIAPISVDSADRMARIVREARGFILGSIQLKRLISYHF